MANTQNTNPGGAGKIVPAEWPGAFGIYKHSKQAVMNNLGLIILTSLLLVLSSIVIDSLISGTSFIEQLLSWLAGAYFTTVLTIAFLSSVRGKSREFGEVYSSAGKYFVNMAVLTFLQSVITIVSLLLLIVPFFIIVPRLTLATYFLVDKDMDAIEALKASWNATKGNVGKVWGIIGASIVFGLLILLIVGIYFLIMYSAAYAILYVYLNKHTASQT